MECPEVTDRLWEYLDGELAAEEAALVDRHLAGCPVCRSHHRCDGALLVLIVRSLSAPCPAPQSLFVAVRERLADVSRDDH
jgi:anti-sigma factor (TIGR02949 family)